METASRGSDYFTEADRARAGWLQVTGLAVSDRHPYMFSCGLDKMVKCWDLEYNKARPHSLTPQRSRAAWYWDLDCNKSRPSPPGGILC